MRIFVWVLMILNALSACGWLIMILEEKFPTTTNRTASDAVVQMLWRIGFALWAACLLFAVK